ncbi:hypothetical protein D3C76_837400 [compost metagenome]
MANRVRAGDTKVDCSDAAVLASTAMDIRIASGPMTGPARWAKTFSWMRGLFRPRPCSLIPANCRVAIAVNRYRPRISSTVQVAALPGTSSLPTDSSLTVRHTSQPQKMKIDSDSPAAKAENDSTPNGLNQAKSNSSGGGAVVSPKAAKAKPISTSNCRATKPYCTVMVVVMPRQQIHTARAMNTQQVVMLMSRLSAKAASSCLPVIWPRNR